MEEKVFQKYLIDAMSKQGFARAKKMSFYKENIDEGFRITIHRKNLIEGFKVSLDLPRESGKEGEFEQVIYNYEFDTLLNSAIRNDYLQSQFECAANMLAEFTDGYITNGKEQLKLHLDEWNFGINYQVVRNRILRWLGEEEVDTYSDQIFEESFEDIRRGGSIVVPITEFDSHREYYEKYVKHGCSIIEHAKDGFVLITSIG